jgi:integrase
MADVQQLTLFDWGVDLGKLRALAHSCKALRAAPATVRAYESDWRVFVAWCRAAGREPLPASPETLELFLAAELPVRALATIERRLASISARHRAAGHSSPVGEDHRAILLGWKRQHGSVQTSKQALTVENLRAMMRACRPNLAGLRDRALISLGFATGLRRSDLVRLDLRDVSISARGLRIFIRRGKTDQLGRGREIGVVAGKGEYTDPVRWLERYIDERGRWDGPLFVSVNAAGVEYSRRRLGAAMVGRVVKAAAARAGLDPSRIGAHSLRAGCVTTAIEAGVSESLVMTLTGHRSHQTLARYVRPARALAVDVLAGAL